MKFPTGLPVGVAAFLAGVDKVIVDRNIPTCGTGLKDGQLFLLLGQAYLDATPREQKMFLQHEAGHFYTGHLIRMEERDPQLWNLAADACLHGHRNCHHGPDFPAVTWEALQLAEMPAEEAYEHLLKRAEDSPCVSCGSMEHSSSDGSTSSMFKAASITKEMGKDPLFSSTDSSNGSSPSGSFSGAYIEAAPPPPWIREVLDYLIDDAYDTARSWRRENRAYRDLPGRAQRHGKAGLFLIDASASVPEEDLAKFIGSVTHTPELVGSMAVGFSHEITPKVPVASIQRTLPAVTGGGTNFAAPAAMRQPGQTVVWLTDGYPNDGWPAPHDGNEVWVITTDVVPPHGVRIGT